VLRLSKKNQDPMKLFDHSTKTDMQYRIEEPNKKKLITLALEKLPEKYVNAFSTLSVSGNVDLEKFEDMVEAIYQANQGKLKSDDEDDNKVDDKKFKKKKNYKKKDRYKKNDNEGKEKCKHCGQTSHDPDKCWMLEKNKERRPEWFDPDKYNKKKQREISTAAVNQARSHPELMLMAMIFPKDLSILENPIIWIADIAATATATCNSTPHHQGAINLHKGNQGVIFGNGRNNEAETTFDLLGIITDQFGNEMISATLQSVKHIKSARFNLFSITKQQKDGWLLIGNSEKIWIEKGEHKIVFDIQIETPEGLIFAMHHKQTKLVVK
jgi:hypothetical protein